jgi:hypothetical protein
MFSAQFQVQKTTASASIRSHVERQCHAEELMPAEATFVELCTFSVSATVRCAAAMLIAARPALYKLTLTAKRNMLDQPMLI